ncbi:hypothetical protein FS837_004634 [Tulasnella sp. UAMH 9824]|nr:hypothetical protein FS837_004634 [Tulasnella sp. UAMH 9824]
MASNIPKAKTLPLYLFSRQYWNESPTDILQQNIKSLLQTYADRWFKISIVSGLAFISPVFTEVLEKSSFSRLEVLKMMGIRGVFHVELGRLERLREAWLSFVPCRGHGPNPGNPAPLLKYLYLDLSHWESYPISCLASFLRHSPNLQDLEILGLSNHEDDSQSRPESFISLPALRSLAIKHTAESEDSPDIRILGLIRCQNLANFKIRFHVYPDPDTDEDPDTEGFDAAEVFRVLRAPSQFEPDALPMSSAFRNMRDSVYFNVVLESNNVKVQAQNRGAPEHPLVDFILPTCRLDMENFSRDILPYLTSFDIPIELISSNRFKQGGSRWAHILDRFRNVTILEFRGTLEPVMELLEALSQPSSSLPGGGPRAPRLETLRLRHEYGYISWTADANQMAPQIAAMLKKRRELFEFAGMVWPSNFRVNLGDYKTFNENEGGWTKMN